MYWCVGNNNSFKIKIDNFPFILESSPSVEALPSAIMDESPVNPPPVDSWEEEADKETEEGNSIYWRLIFAFNNMPKLVSAGDP